MKHLVSSLILAGVLMVPGPSVEARSHWPGPLGGHHGKFWKRGDVRRKLELTEDQVRSLEQIFARNEQMLADLEADVKKKKADFEFLLADDRDDDKRIMAQVDLLEQARANLGKARVAIRARGEEGDHDLEVSVPEGPHASPRQGAGSGGLGADSKRGAKSDAAGVPCLGRHGPHVRGGDSGAGRRDQGQGPSIRGLAPEPEARPGCDRCAGPPDPGAPHRDPENPGGIAGAGRYGRGRRSRPPRCRSSSMTPREGRMRPPFPVNDPGKVRGVGLVASSSCYPQPGSRLLTGQLRRR